MSNLRQPNAECGHEFTFVACGHCLNDLHTQLADALKRAEGAEAALKRRYDNSVTLARLSSAVYRAIHGDAPETLVWASDGDMIERLSTPITQLRADLAAERERTDWPGTERMELIKRAIRAEHALARVTEERDLYKRSADDWIREAGLQEDAATAAQERIQALEGMVGMLRGALIRVAENDKGGIAAAQIAHKYLNLTESQAAEVVRGMVEALSGLVDCEEHQGWARRIAMNLLTDQNGETHGGTTWLYDVVCKARTALEAVRGLG